MNLNVGSVLSVEVNNEIKFDQNTQQFLRGLSLRF